MVPRFIGVPAALSLLAACAGAVSNPSGPSGGNVELSSRDVTFACKAETPAGDAMHRLSRTQYENTVHDLLEAQLPSHIKDTWGEVESAFSALPADTIAKTQPFATMDQAVSQQHVDTYFAISQAVAQALTADDARVDALLSCNEGEADTACVTRFIRDFGRHAFRHTLREDEFSYLWGVYGANGIDVAALRDTIVVALNAPQFLYRVEFGGKAVGKTANLFQLSDAELATRLAYHFWQTMPDDELLDMADEGALGNEAAYTALVERMMGDRRTEQSLRVFLREWLHLDDLRPLDSLVGDPVFDAIAGEDKPSSQLRDDMIDDVVDSFIFHLGRDDSFADWFVSPYSFATSDELAALYGTEKWDGKAQEPPRFPAGERSGLLTRAALLSTGTAKTRPIIKGVFVRERILCDRVPPPPANATSIPVELTTKMSTREVVETLTEQPKSQCSSCHSTMINALGFATENYDALGRLRTNEVLYSADGKELGEKPVDTTSVPRIWQNDDQVSNGAEDLTEMIVQSGKAESCFARQYIRFAYGRREDEEVDGCALEAVRSALQDGQSLQQAIRAPALRPEFRQRFVGDVP
jgi:hypothetical protein